MHPFLQRQNIQYAIVVVHQTGTWYNTWKRDFLCIKQVCMEKRVLEYISPLINWSITIKKKKIKRTVK